VKKLFNNLLTSAAAVAALSGAAHGAIVEVASGDIAADTRWTRDNVYVLNGPVYVLPPAKLTVEPGTLIRGARDNLTTGTLNPGSLVICRGAKLVGSGTVDDPIIFTSADDTLVKGGANTRPVTVGGNAVGTADYSINGAATTNAFAYSRIAGGLVVLGRAPIAFDGNGAATLPNYNDATNTFSGDALSLPTGNGSGTGVAAGAGNGNGFAYIEGISNTSVTLGAALDPDGVAGFTPAASPFVTPAEGAVTGSGTIAATTTFFRNIYGGVDENDDSGVMRFWSIRYGGELITANIEVNGYTTGAVGRNTIAEFIDVANNADDAFEFFGGYNNLRYLSGWFCGDDYIDWDQGYSGNIQNVFINTGGGEGFGRTIANGYSLNDATTAGKNTSQNNSDKAFELDGPEPDNADFGPKSDGWVFNVTVVGNRGGTTATATDDMANPKVGTAGQISHMVVENINDQVLSVSGDSGVSPTWVTTDLLEGFSFHLGAADTATARTLNNLVSVAASQLVDSRNGGLKVNGINPTLIDEVPAGTNVPARKLTAAAPSRSGVQNFFSPVTYRGGLRDNNWMFGWTWAHDASLLPLTNLDRPVVTLSVSGSNVNVSFNADTTATAAGDAVLYVVERSDDGGATFVPFVAVQDGGVGDLAGAGTIQVQDPVAYAGAATQYRVIPQ
jgi:plastocyanin